MYMQNVHAKNETQSKIKREDPGWSAIDTTVVNRSYFLWLEKTIAGTYLHYILPAHPDHNCEKDALVRRQRGPEGSYPSLSGR